MSAWACRMAVPAGVAVAAAKLEAMFPEGGVDEMVEAQPLLLVEDVEDVVGELERWVQACSAAGRGGAGRRRVVCRASVPRRRVLSRGRCD